MEKQKSTESQSVPHALDGKWRGVNIDTYPEIRKRELKILFIKLGIPFHLVYLLVGKTADMVRALSTEEQPESILGPFNRIEQLKKEIEDIRNRPH